MHMANFTNKEAMKVKCEKEHPLGFFDCYIVNDSKFLSFFYERLFNRFKRYKESGYLYLGKVLRNHRRQSNEEYRGYNYWQATGAKGKHRYCSTMYRQR